MDKFLKNKWICWIFFIFTIAWLVCDVIIGVPKYAYIPVFLAFMSAFCNIASLYLAKISPAASKKLDKIDIVLCTLFILSGIAIIFIK